MKIGIIAPPWGPVPPPAYGGIEAVIDLQARGFQAAGHDVLLYTVGDSTCPVPRRWTLPTADRIDIGICQYEFQHVIHAYEAMREEDVDIIHDHTVGGLLIGTRQHDIQVVTTNHGPAGGVLGDMYHFAGVDIPVIAISHHQAAATISSVPIAAVIHHGIDLEELTPGTGSGDYALFLGRVAPDKGIVEAVIAAREAGVKLVVAAKLREASEQDYFDRFVRPHLGNRIEYIGEVSRADRIKLLQDAKLLLNPIPLGREESSSGLVMMEALACGTPVVSSKFSIAVEIIDQGVTGVLAGDLDETVEAIFEAKKIERATCRSAAERRFSAGRMVDDHLRLFRQLLEEPVIDLNVTKMHSRSTVVDLQAASSSF